MEKPLMTLVTMTSVIELNLHVTSFHGSDTSSRSDIMNSDL